MVQSVSAPGEGIDLAELENHLLHIEVIGYEPEVNTRLGAKDAVKANVTPLDGDNAGDTTRDTLLFPKVLVSQLKGHQGSAVVGRLGKGTAKPGQSAPWILNPATDDEVALAQRFEAARAQAAGPQSVAPPATEQPPATTSTPAPGKW